MTSVLHLPRRDCTFSSNPPMTVSSVETSGELFKPGQRSTTRPRRGSMTSRPHMNRLTDKQTVEILTKFGRSSKPVCIARYSRQRKLPGQSTAEVYLKTMRKRSETVADVITRVFNNKLAGMNGDSEAQIKLMFSMWDVLAGSQTRETDAIRAITICKPEDVPAYIKRQMVAEDVVIELDECDYCASRTLVHIDDEARAGCETCGAMQSIQLHYEMPWMMKGPQAGGVSTQAEAPGAQVVSKHVYDRLSHFRAILHNIQGRCQGKLCEKMMATLADRLAGTPPAMVTHTLVQTMLKSMKQGKYVPQATRIAYILSDKTCVAPDIPAHVVDMMCMDFSLVCIHYDAWINSHTASKRKNFMSYPFILAKLLARHNMDNLLPFVSVIKSDARRGEQVKLWNIVCEGTGWKI